MKPFVWVLLATLRSVDLHAQIYSILHNFGGSNHDGYAPLTDLVLSADTLYGTTASGGTNGNGTIFRINTDASSYAIIKNFTNGAPEGGMVLIGNTLYGTTFTGGSADNGTIFKLIPTAAVLRCCIIFRRPAPLASCSGPIATAIDQVVIW